MSETKLVPLLRGPSDGLSVPVPVGKLIPGYRFEVETKNSASMDIEAGEFKPLCNGIYEIACSEVTNNFFAFHVYQKEKDNARRAD